MELHIPPNPKCSVLRSSCAAAHLEASAIDAERPPQAAEAIFRGFVRARVPKCSFLDASSFQRSIDCEKQALDLVSFSSQKTLPIRYANSGVSKRAALPTKAAWKPSSSAPPQQQARLPDRSVEDGSSGKASSC